MLTAIIIGFVLLVLLQVTAIMLNRMELNKQVCEIRTIAGNNQNGTKDEIISVRKEVNENLKINREEISLMLKNSSDSMMNQIKLLNDTVDNKIQTITADNQYSQETLRNLLQTKFESVIDKKMTDSFKAISEKLESANKKINEELLANRTEMSNAVKANREELTLALKNTTDLLLKEIKELTKQVETKLNLIQTDNSQKLEKMRETVDEKLHATLEKRLGESFKLVTDKLEIVQKGFGEMQQLATGVGDLKKVMMNVKSRGGWSEMQLGKIIEDFMLPEQYEKEVSVKKGSKEKVEYAIKFPGQNEKETLYLPIDAKFPKEDYEKILEAQEKGDLASIETYSKALENRVKSEAKDIKDKYISPPQTTDFGVMFIPTEGLYAEIAKKPGLTDKIQREYKVLIAGPTILAALLNSFQMGFKTLAIQKRTSEVWQVLETVKTEFGNFGNLLEKTKEKIDQASKTIEDATKKTRKIEGKLSNLNKLEAKQKAEISLQEEVINTVEEIEDAPF